MSSYRTVKQVYFRCSKRVDIDLRSSLPSWNEWWAKLRCGCFLEFLLLPLPFFILQSVFLTENYLIGSYRSLMTVGEHREMFGLANWRVISIRMTLLSFPCRLFRTVIGLLNKNLSRLCLPETMMCRGAQYVSPQQQVTIKMCECTFFFHFQNINLKIIS
jgi:hypothetical protein